MRILFLTTAHNGLSQRAYLELVEQGHTVEVQLATSDEAMEMAVAIFKPELIIAPFLKKAVPDSIWKNMPVLIVHPGLKGDRGPSSLDWAIMDNWQEWGVTILQAAEEMDAGDIWASHNFKMRDVSKSNLYRHEVTQAALTGILEAVARFADKDFVPEPLDYNKPDVKGKLHQPVKTSDRKLDWAGSSDEIIRKIKAADSTPGVLDTILGEDYRLFGAHKEGLLRGVPGDIIAQRDGAICRATGDGAVWISHMKKNPDGIKLPATMVLKEKVSNVPVSDLNPFEKHPAPTFREIWYEEEGEVGFLHFDFYNGAMSTDQCTRLRETLSEAKLRPTKVIVLMGGHDIWSNGIHLNVIENAAHPGQESWSNIVAMNDLVREIILTSSQIVVSAMQGNAGAGGAILALAADKVYARRGIVLNPHYKKMGNLYGSEYWTYLLPRRVGQVKALELTDSCMPLSTTTAKQIGFIDDHFGDDIAAFTAEVRERAFAIAKSEDFTRMIMQKRSERALDEEIKPLSAYRKEELAQMELNFFGDDISYHLARFHFVHKIACQVQPVEEALKKYALSSVLNS